MTGTELVMIEAGNSSGDDLPGRVVARRRAVDEHGLAGLDQRGGRYGPAVLGVDVEIETL